jgi:hypothetical protein
VPCVEEASPPSNHTQGRQIHCSSAPDCGAFQITRAIISPNNFYDTAEAPDREALVASIDVPTQASETKEHQQQRENDNVV